MGCFWEPAESLLKTPGVLSTTVGYTGAPPNKPPPTYDTVCFGRDYVEAVRVVYDDEIIDYETLLDNFFELQKPGYSRQYSSIIFVDDEHGTERDVAAGWKTKAIENKVKREKDNLSHEIVEIEPLSSFYRAEEYHQRYWEKQRLRAVTAIGLIAGSSGAYDDLLMNNGILDKLEAVGMSFDTICNGIFLLGAAWMIFERIVARDVRELKRGELIASTEAAASKP
jgi:peptide-methionine (S)-S-oxide reductase